MLTGGNSSCPSVIMKSCQFVLWVIVSYKTVVCPWTARARSGSCLSSKSDKLELATALKKDCQPVFNWGNEWRLKLIASKANMLSFNDHREPCLHGVIMADAKYQERIRYAFRASDFSDMDWSTYIELITRSTAGKVGLLRPVRQFFLSKCFLHIYKFVIRTCI